MNTNTWEKDRQSGVKWENRRGLGRKESTRQLSSATIHAHSACNRHERGPGLLPGYAIQRANGGRLRGHVLPRIFEFDLTLSSKHFRPARPDCRGWALKTRPPIFSKQHDALSLPAVGSAHFRRVSLGLWIHLLLSVEARRPWPRSWRGDRMDPHHEQPNMLGQRPFSDGSIRIGRRARKRQ